MNFHDLKKIETSDFYLDLAFRKAKKFSINLKKSLKIKDDLKKLKEIEIQKLDFIRTFFKEEFRKILVSYPSLNNLDIFYQELIKCTLDYVFLKKSLASLNWAINKIDSFFFFYKDKIKNDNSYLAIKKHSKEFYGRVSSVIKQIKKHLLYLEESRKIMKEYPIIKTSVFTICIFGFPNVGKSTLLSKLTTSKPEINSYPFTTKSLNLGYIKEDGKVIQIIDAPGTLNRLEKMNNIELQGYLALKYVSNAIIYVFDPTFEYDFEKQEKLFLKLKKFEKPILLYLSKIDIAEKENIEEIKKKHPDIITDLNILKEKIFQLDKTK